MRKGWICTVMKWVRDRVVRERLESGQGSTHQPPPPPPPPPNTPPTFTASPGSYVVLEGTTAVTTLSAIGTAPITYSIVGGTDGARFLVGSTTGIVQFVTPPDYSAPIDANADNVYQAIIRAQNTYGADTKTITASILEDVVATAPTITSNGGGASATINIPNDTRAIAQVTATGTSPITYSVSGVDASSVQMDSISGIVQFNANQSYVSGGDNDRAFNVVATNSAGTDSQALTVNIQAPPAPVGNSPTMPLATIIDRMRTNQNGKLIDGSDPPNRYPAIRMPVNYDFWRLAYDPYGAEHPYKFDSIAPWFWVYPAQFSTASGKRLEVRRSRVGVNLDSFTGSWWDSGAIPFQNSFGQVWNARSATGLPISSYARNQTSESMSIFTSGTTGIEIWNRDFYVRFGRTLAARARNAVWICECRVINEDGTPYTGADSKWLVSFGYDPYNSQRDNAFNATFASGIYPNAADGAAPTWTVIDGSMGWVSIGGIGVTGTDRSFVDGPPLPFGNYTGGPGAWLGDDAPYVPTPAQLAANPPTFIVT